MAKDKNKVSVKAWIPDLHNTVSESEQIHESRPSLIINDNMHENCI